MARFQKARTAFCHRAAKRRIRYIQGTTTLGLNYSMGEFNLQCFVDSDYCGDVFDGKAMSGDILKIGNAMCSWGAKKQKSVSLSTCESEYFPMTMAVQEVLWTRRILEEIGISVNYSVPLRSYHQASIQWAAGGTSSSGRAKHIGVRVHFLHDLVAEMMVGVVYVPSEINDADFLTKPLGRILHCRAMARIGLGSAFEEDCCDVYRMCRSLTFVQFVEVWLM